MVDAVHPPRRKAVQQIGNRKHIKNALHVALEMNDAAVAEALIETGDSALLNMQSGDRGPTPLMLLAMGRCASHPSTKAWAEKLLWKLLEHGGGASIAVRSKTRRSAADYAQEARGHSAELVRHLCSLEATERDRTSGTRCEFCGDELQPPATSPLALAARRAERGEEPNALLRSFFAAGSHLELMKPALHQLVRLKAVRKELSESLAVLEALDAFNDISSCHAIHSRHVIDLACGRGITATLAALRYPGSRVSAIDRLEPMLMPHWGGTDRCRVRYLQQDMLHASFVNRISELCRAEELPTEIATSAGFLTEAHVLEEIGISAAIPSEVATSCTSSNQLAHVALLGVHLCGELSLRAIAAFEQCEHVTTLVLSPCCLPKQVRMRMHDWCVCVCVCVCMYAGCNPSAYPEYRLVHAKACCGLGQSSSKHD